MGTLYSLNFPNGKRYIGITTRPFYKRLASHRHAARNSFNLPLYRAWTKYGHPWVQVLAIVEDSDLNETEIRAIASFGTLTPNGYNLSPGGTTGAMSNPEVAAKVSAKLKGRAFTPEHRANIAAAQRRRIRRPISPEARARLIEAGKNLSPEQREVFARVWRGRKHTPETRAKMAETARNRSPEYLAKQRAAHLGKGHSPETRAMFSTTRKGVSRAERAARKAENLARKNSESTLPES